MSTDEAAQEGSPRIGRPPKVDAAGRPTRERLLAAATEACVEHGFEGVTLADIASRAEVSTPAVYNHFGGKTDLLVEACRWALSRLTPEPTEGPLDPQQVARTYLSPAFSDARVLQLELHLASTRHADVRELLAAWHTDNLDRWATERKVPKQTVKTWYLLLLGLAQIDALATVQVPHAKLEHQVDALVAALFDNP